jgi:hypothetical protein
MTAGDLRHAPFVHSYATRTLVCAIYYGILTL